jgi:transposase
MPRRPAARQLRNLADDLREDYDAVLADLTTEWNQGMVEGFNNKI